MSSNQQPAWTAARSRWAHCCSMIAGCRAITALPARLVIACPATVPLPMRRPGRPGARRRRSIHRPFSMRQRTFAWAGAATSAVWKCTRLHCSKAKRHAGRYRDGGRTTATRHGAQSALSRGLWQATGSRRAVRCHRQLRTLAGHAGQSLRPLAARQRHGIERTRVTRLSHLQVDRLHFLPPRRQRGRQSVPAQRHLRSRHTGWHPILRVPSLRNVATTAPYFHDGSASTLPQAIKAMGTAQLGVALSPADVSDIAAFLNTLTGKHQGRQLTAPHP